MSVWGKKSFFTFEIHRVPCTIKALNHAGVFCPLFQHSSSIITPPYIRFIFVLLCILGINHNVSFYLTFNNSQQCFTFNVCGIIMVKRMAMIHNNNLKHH